MREIIIEANRLQGAYWKDLFRSRELLFFFAWRDLLVRYKEALLGVAWALVRPLLTLGAFTLIFGKLAGFPTEGVSYPLFALAGMVPWMFFSNTLSEATLSLLNNPALLTRVYFPRMVLPLSQILVQAVDFIISFALLLALVPFLGAIDFSTVWILPFYLLLLSILSIASALMVSAITVKWRDVRFIVPFFVQFGLYISPVGYGSAMIPEKWQWLFFMNPMAAIIEGFRYALFGVKAPFLFEGTLLSLFISCALLFLGVKIFRKIETEFGDLI